MDWGANWSSGLELHNLSLYCLPGLRAPPWFKSPRGHRHLIYLLQRILEIDNQVDTQ